MQLRNREGTAVDPVPFLVVVSLAFAVCYSFGPSYWMAVGFDLAGAVALSTTAFAASATAAYHRLVWTYRPSVRMEVPARTRLRRLVWFLLVALAALALLMLPLLPPTGL